MEPPEFICGVSLRFSAKDVEVSSCPQSCVTAASARGQLGRGSDLSPDTRNWKKQGIVVS